MSSLLLKRAKKNLGGECFCKKKAEFFQTLPMIAVREFYSISTLDSLELRLPVIPAKAGIQH